MPIARSSRRLFLRAAFTLMELGAVLGILGILLAVGGSVFFGQREEARKDRARAELQVIQQGLEAYKARFGDYPQIPAGYAGLEPVSTPAAYLLNALCGQIGPAHDVISGSGIPVMLNTSVLSFAGAALPYASRQDTEIIDPWGTPYRYDSEPLNSDGVLLFGYILGSAGPDETFDTGDDIVAE